MYNWSVNLKELKKTPQEYQRWRLEQMINFGLGGQKIRKKLLKKYWQKVEIDFKKREYLKFLLCQKKS